jgi:hypothetical protein
MSTRLEQRGTSISGPDSLPDCQVSAVDAIGLWLLVGDREYLIPFADYPQFREARVEQVFAVRMISPQQMRWETLDIDVELEALTMPEHYPLVWQGTCSIAS